MGENLSGVGKVGQAGFKKTGAVHACRILFHISIIAFFHEPHYLSEPADHRKNTSDFQKSTPRD